MNGDARTIPPGELAEMDAVVEADWRVADATLTDSGHLLVYRLALDTPEGPRRAVLKAEPSDADTGVALEARLLRGLAAQTDLPVP